MFLGLMVSTAVSFAGPFDAQVNENIAGLRSPEARVRYRAAERLGYLRSCAAEPALIEALNDDAAEVRRAAAMALGWCGTRESLRPLTDSLDDNDWTVRQAAHVSLTNLTGVEFAFNALGKLEDRHKQAAHWQRWVAAIPANSAPPEILKLLEEKLEEEIVGIGYAVQFSSVYKGSAEVLFDGRLRTGHWQTKNVKTPQWVLVDMVRPRAIDRVIVHQHSKPFVMTGWEVAVSVDGKTYKTVGEDRSGSSPVRLEVRFPRQSVRYVRVSSFGGVKLTYPTTITELEILAPGETPGAFLQEAPAEFEKVRYLWQAERAFRALGVFAPPDASGRIIKALGPAPAYSAANSPTVQAGLRALGRLRQPAGFDY
ncbi:MAG: HEAT repeat domain-containing protein, partial [Planctomycetota bacterium]